MPDLTKMPVTELIECLSSEAWEFADASHDPVAWLLRAAERYAKEQARCRNRIDTRTYQDRREYLRKYAKDRRAKNRCVETPM